MKFGLLIFLLAVSNILVWHSFIAKHQRGAFVSFLDVGQGDSALIQANGVDILMDAGPGSRVLYGLQKTLPRTDKYIDLVIISHPHADHYRGLEYVLSNYEVGAIIWNGAESVEAFNKILEQARAKNIPIVDVFAGSSIASRDLKINTIYPPRGADEETLAGNDGSLVMLTEIGELSGLFTGDITRRAEALISTINFPDMDFLKIPHHGSRTSSSQSFLDAVNPQVAIMTIGRNRYGLPDEDVLARYASFDIPVFRTDEHNGIRLIKNNGNLRVESLE